MINETVNFREIILSGESSIREEFINHFKRDIFHFIELITYACDEFVKFRVGLPKEDRSAWVESFLYQAFNSLFTSFQLLISGFIIPSNHLMRQYIESIAVALLFSHPATKEFELFLSSPRKYPFHKAINTVSKHRNVELLNIDPEGWNSFAKIRKIFHGQSHPSAVNTSLVRMLDQPYIRILGAGFDEAKKDYYLQGIQLRQSASESFCDTLIEVKDILLKTRSDISTS